MYIMYLESKHGIYFRIFNLFYTQNRSADIIQNTSILDYLTLTEPLTELVSQAHCKDTGWL